MSGKKLTYVSLLISFFLSVFSETSAQSLFPVLPSPTPTLTPVFTQTPTASPIHEETQDVLQDPSANDMKAIIIPCGYCHETKECSQCQGTGFLADSAMVCPVCRESGKCVICDGEGYIVVIPEITPEEHPDVHEDRSSINLPDISADQEIDLDATIAAFFPTDTPKTRIECPICEGTGDCGGCNGKGFLVNGTYMCTICWGTGDCDACDGKGYKEK